MEFAMGRPPNRTPDDQNAPREIEKSSSDRPGDSQERPRQQNSSFSIDFLKISEKNTKIFKNLSKVSESYKSQILDYVKILKSQKKIVKDAKLLFVSEYMENAFEYNIDIENK